MKNMMLVTFMLVGFMAVFVSADSSFQETFQPYPYKQPIAYEDQMQVRNPRSPQQQNPPQPNRGSISVTGGHTSGAGSFARGDYNHKLWEGRNGARVDANTFYQRNWGAPGPRQDYGGGVRLSVPFGR